MNFRLHKKLNQSKIFLFKYKKFFSNIIETILSPEQYNTLETNRKRLETERQQLRQLGII